MKVIHDTNVVVSAILRDRVPEQIILFIVEQPDFEWIASKEILAEYLDVLARPKFDLPQEILQKWISVFNRAIRIVEVANEVNFPRDQKDARFLSCALATRADYLVTGDKDFDAAHKFGNTTILSVSKFKSFVIDGWGDE